MKIRVAVLTVSMTINSLSPTFADVNSDMNTFFNKLGFDSNTTQPQVWQGQPGSRSASERKISLSECERVRRWRSEPLQSKRPGYREVMA